MTSTTSPSGASLAAAPPSVTSVAVPAAGVYGERADLIFTVDFDAPVTVTGTPQLSLTVGSTTRQAGYVSGSGSSSLVFRYTIAAGETDADGITVGTLALNGGTLTDAASNSADLTLQNVASAAAVLVETAAPVVSSVLVPTNATYKTGDALNFTVNFDEAVTVTGAPRLALVVGSTTRQATYVSGSGTSALVFRYAAQSGDLDTNGITLGSLALNGGTLTDAAGNAAVLTLNSVGSTTAVRVDAVAPTVSQVRPSTSSTTYYKTGGVISITVTFNEAVTVSGTPQLGIMVGSTLRQAGYFSGSGGLNLTFRYTVQDGDTDADGIAVGTLATNGGSLRDAVGNDASLTLLNISSTANLRVDTTPPEFVSVTATGGRTYKIGDVVQVSVNFNEAVRNQGIPKLGLVLETGTVLTGSYTISGASVILGYTVQAGDFSDGFQTATAFTLNGVTVGDLALNPIVNSLPATTFSTIKIDGVLPTVQSIAPVRAVAGPSGAAFTVTFSEAVTGVDASDFVLAATGTAAGTIASVTGSGSTYTVNLTSVSGEGTLRLDLKSAGTGVADVAGNAIATGGATGQTVTIDSTPPGLPTIAAVAGDDTISAGEVSGLAFGGTIEAGATVALTIGGVAKTAVVSGTSWSYAVSQAEIDAWGTGSKIIAVTATDAAGNVSATEVRAFTVDASALAPPPQPDPEPEPPRPPSLVDLTTRPAAAFVDLALDSLQIAPGSAKTGSPTITLPDGSVAASTAAKAQADINAAVVQFKAGAISQALLEERLTDAVASTTGVAHDAYVFFTGSAPTSKGMTWLIDSADNPNDLTDGYYAKFSVENRYINFAINLGKVGEGRAAFDAKYGALTFADAVAKAYGEIIGVAEAQAAGVDVPAALRYIQAQESYFRALGGDDLGAKAAMAGFVLSAGTAYHVGKSYEALEDYVVATIVSKGGAAAAPAWDLG
ncbi:hypothetical protein [Caulobacter segnis]|uniref:Bacterial Ig-like domain-containing protein n=1 Tax=Caulobacter segnis TaxID=88688 RepID=A0A2W5VC79_9CAUL|nr:hypothetical protein [Caulobacter segnis]PZR34236.1 MAG: hypothetical protein DI526_11050 [Caulobacter segnis]